MILISGYLHLFNTMHISHDEAFKPTLFSFMYCLPLKYVYGQHQVRTQVGFPYLGLSQIGESIRNAHLRKRIRHGFEGDLTINFFSIYAIHSNPHFLFYGYLVH